MMMHHAHPQSTPYSMSKSLNGSGRKSLCKPRSELDESLARDSDTPPINDNRIDDLPILDAEAADGAGGDAPTMDDNSRCDRSKSLNSSQLRECANMAERIRAWTQERAREWGTSVHAVAEPLSLNDKECRVTSLWNKHQSRFFTEDKRGPNESLDEHRARCAAEYAEMTGENIVGELTPEQIVATDARRDELEKWWRNRETKQASDTVQTGDRYKVMVDARDELNEKAQWLSERYQIELVAAVVSGAPDDLDAREASFVVTGNSITREWLDKRNVSTARFLGDLETLCRGHELKNRGQSYQANLGAFSSESNSRDARNSAVRERLLLLLNEATNSSFKKFHWQDFGKMMVTYRQTLWNWPYPPTYPGGPRPLTQLGNEGYRSVFERMQLVNIPTHDPKDHLQIKAWSEAQKKLKESDPEYDNIPIVVGDQGRVLLRAGDIDAMRYALAKNTAKQRISGAKATFKRRNLKTVNIHDDDLCDTSDDDGIRVTRVHRRGAPSKRKRREDYSSDEDRRSAPSEKNCDEDRRLASSKNGKKYYSSEEDRRPASSKKKGKKYYSSDEDRSSEKKRKEN